MSAHDYRSVEAPDADPMLAAIADYVRSEEVGSELAFTAARHCLLDSLACGLRALRDPACTRLLGPVVPGATLPGGARVPGTSYELDPVQAAFNIGTMSRWLDEDTGLAAEWGHPADGLGGILAVADYLSRRALMEASDPLTLREVLAALIKSCEIQGVLARGDGCDRHGPDHLTRVRIASAAVLAAMLRGTREQVIDAVANAWTDGDELCACSRTPGSGSRKRWAAAGAVSSQAVHLALLALAGAIQRSCGVSRQGGPPSLPQPLGSHVMEHAGRCVSGLTLPGQKLESAAAAHFGARQTERIRKLLADPAKLDALPVTAFMAALVRN